MASFDSATFDEHTDDTQYPTWDAKMLLSIKQLAGNNGYVTQEIGEDVRRVAIPARASGTELAALYDKHQTSGSLIFSYETTDAYLEDIDGVAQVANNDRFDVTLHFIKL